MDRIKPKAPKRNGIVRLQTPEIAGAFLQTYGGTLPPKFRELNGRRVHFQASTRIRFPTIPLPRRQYLNNTQDYLDPTRDVGSQSIRIAQVQFGWNCRDKAFSVEHEQDQFISSLQFDPRKRQLQVAYHALKSTIFMVVDFVQIINHIALEEDWSIYLTLKTAPRFEELYEGEQIRRRLRSFGASHEALAPYTSTAIRLVCGSLESLLDFIRLGAIAKLPEGNYVDYDVEYREIFSKYNLDALDEWVRFLPWEVAFQVEAMTKNCAVDPEEMLTLKEEVQQLITSKGASYTAALLLAFAYEAECLKAESSQDYSDGVFNSFIDFVGKYQYPPGIAQTQPDSNVFDCRHVYMRPSTMALEVA